MNYSLLSIKESSLLLAFMQIAFVLVTLNLVFNITKYNKKRLFISIIIFIITILNLGSLMELIHLHHTKVNLSYISIIINKIPHYLQYLYILFITSFSLFNMYKLTNESKGKISNNTVKDAIENLPCGLVFYDKNGYIYLSNKVMNNLSLELTKKDLQNGNELWNDIANKNLEEDIFISENKTIWKIFKENINIDGTIYQKIQADDITDIYNLSVILKNKNKQLKKDQKKLIEHMKNIDEYISEEETLKLKIKVHDNFGELITLTTKMYKENIKNKDKKILIKNWDILDRKMKYLLPYKNINHNSLEKVNDLSKRLDCKININGIIPNDKTNKEIFIYALNEMLKNAVNHTNAKSLLVNIIYKNNQIIITIKNKNKNNIYFIKEGGGLSSIRNKIEKINGIMEITCNEFIILKIILKEVKNV